MPKNKGNKGIGTYMFVNYTASALWILVMLF